MIPCSLEGPFGCTCSKWKINVDSVERERESERRERERERKRRRVRPYFPFLLLNHLFFFLPTFCYVLSLLPFCSLINSFSCSLNTKLILKGRKALLLVMKWYDLPWSPLCLSLVLFVELPHFLYFSFLFLFQVKDSPPPMGGIMPMEAAMD